MWIDLYSFPSLLKHIRAKAWLTQEQFAKKLKVSTILIAQVETKKREPSKKLIIKLANKLNICAFSLMPFLDNKEILDIDSFNSFEKMIYSAWTRLQKDLIDKRIYLLKK